jgi:hypothetical protein
MAKPDKSANKQDEKETGWEKGGRFLGPSLK